ncbi:MAG TPA: sialidase family protein, partial [Prosthecobacter sp.]
MRARPILSAFSLLLFLSPALAQTKLQKADVTLTPPKNLKTKLPLSYTIPIVDISAEKGRQVIVDREAGQYLGHPTTLLLEDNKTILTVYPKGHGRGAIQYKRSNDGGLTWSERLPTPKNWETSLEVPTLHRVVDAAGQKRIIMFSGLYPIRMAVSEDDGANWSELKSIGDFGGVVTMSTVISLKTPGHYMAFFHDDGRFIRGGNVEKYFVKSPH